MRRISLAIMAVIFLFSLSACGKDEGKAVKEEKGKQEAAAVKMPQAMSASVVHKAAGKTTSSRMFISSGKFRMESEEMAGSYMIVRRDLKKVWMVMAQNKSYIEMPEGKESETPLPDEKMKGEVSRKELGKETVDGHPAVKYEITAKVGDKTTTFHQWMATDISFPVKMAAVDGSWTVEYRDIKIGPQADSLFEIPAGFQKMDMPAMPGKRSK